MTKRRPPTIAKALALAWIQAGYAPQHNGSGESMWEIQAKEDYVVRVTKCDRDEDDKFFYGSDYYYVVSLEKGSNHTYVNAWTGATNFEEVKNNIEQAFTHLETA